MTFYNDKATIVSDSSKNINLFRLMNGKIKQYYFDKKSEAISEKEVGKEVLLEHNASIDSEDNIYLIYQDMSFNLILTLLKDEKMETIKLTGESIPEVYYLDIILNDKEPHIFYCILLPGIERKYRIYHHYFNGKDWITNIVDEIKTNKLLNPIKVIKYDKELVIGYFDKYEEENICIKFFNLEEKEWGRKIQLTNNSMPMLYIDILLIDEKLNLVYCQHDGNMTVKYERFNYKNNIVQKEIEEVLSNEENPQYPTLIYFEKKLWITWIEYENVMSRYSDDNGSTWSPIYLWNESKYNDIVRYKYCNLLNIEDNILNHSFGRIYPDITFLGFGALDNTTEIPLKKKIHLNIPRF